MTPRNLFNIILKIFGLFFLKEIILAIPQIVYLLLSFSNTDMKSEEIYAIIGLAVIFIVSTFFVILLIFKANIVIDKLKLDQGFNQESFSLNIVPSQILTIALIVISGIILITEIPNFCKQIFSYFQQRNMVIYKYDRSEIQISPLIISGVKIVLSFLIIGERKRIVALMLRQSDTNIDTE